jgi:hypothetical protein
MTQALLFDSGTSLRGSTASTAFAASAPVESQKGSITATLTCHLARLMVSSPAKQRAAFRAGIVALFAKARDPWRCIDEMLQVCTSEGGPDGLDAAIDVLAKTGQLILEYAWDYLHRDLRHWDPTTDRAYRPNDDYWYVLLRAVARAAVSQKERFRFIGCCAHAESRGIREGVVEALRDLGSPAAKERLRRFAAEDGDSYIQQIAREALDDLGS